MYKGKNNVLNAILKALRQLLCKCLLALLMCFFLASCQREDPYLYDRVGFSPGREPYRGAPPVYYPMGNVPNPNIPNSRSYNNPYDFPPRNYQQYYDLDRYYVPPTYYRNIEPEYNTGADLKY